VPSEAPAHFHDVGLALVYSEIAVAGHDEDVWGATGGARVLEVSRSSPLRAVKRNQSAGLEGEAEWAIG
jgi:hypothetical protein